RQAHRRPRRYAVVIKAVTAGRLEGRPNAARRPEDSWGHFDADRFSTRRGPTYMGDCRRESVRWPRPHRRFPRTLRAAPFQLTAITAHQPPFQAGPPRAAAPGSQATVPAARRRTFAWTRRAWRRRSGTLGQR